MGMEDNVALIGNPDDRVVQLLWMARRYARLAQLDARPRKQDALTELEDIVMDQLAALAITPMRMIRPMPRNLVRPSAADGHGDR